MPPTPLVALDHSPGRAPTVVVIGTDHGAVAPFGIGGEEFVVAAGPCSVEGREMLDTTATRIVAAGARLLRGGAFKPRTSPYSFQGLGVASLEWLAEARARTGLAVVTEALDVRTISTIARYADVLQIGARNMHNVPLLEAAGDTGLPILLKRGLAATLEELLSAAEYVALRGHSRIVLCERGIRTFESSTRNTLDISAIPVLKRETHLPVIIDPSHAAGRAELVAPLARAALAAGADGLLVEVHPDPATALSDGEQSLSCEGFDAMMMELRAIAPAVSRTLHAVAASRAVPVPAVGRRRRVAAGGRAR
jgi:3-deoxy-7-phosphoheptulonate synthase